MTINEETQRKLSQDLPAGAVKTREQGGAKVDYIDGHFAMTRANEVFGHDGWSYSTRSISEVYRGTKPGRDGENIVIVYEAIVCVSALGCTREDVGIGQCDSSLRNLGQAIEKGRKEAVTDAVKRALRSFGASFGLALYDKTKADVGASFAAQEAFDALDNANDAAALDKARGVVKSLWESLSDGERETAAEKRDKAAKRIERSQRNANATTPATPAQEPQQRRANPMEGLGIEAPPKRPQNAEGTLAQPIDAAPVAEAPAWRVALDALQESAPDLAGYCNAVEALTLPGDAAPVWRKHRDAIGAMAKTTKAAAWGVIVARVESLGQKGAATWLAKGVKMLDADADAPATTEVQS